MAWPATSGPTRGEFIGRRTQAASYGDGPRKGRGRYWAHETGQWGEGEWRGNRRVIGGRFEKRGHVDQWEGGVGLL